MDHTLVIGIAGVISYIIFKRTETISSTNLLILLFFVPIFLAVVPVPSGILEPRYGDFLGIRVVISFIGYYTTILSCVVLYRLSPWHPLAKYPGPLICKITKLKGAIVGHGGKQYLYYRDLHRKYGDVVRIGPNELSFLSASAINPILGQSGQNYVPRGPYFDGRFPETQKIYPIGALRDAEEHHRRRIPWSKAFSTNALKEYEVLVRAKTEVLAEKLVSISGKGTKIIQMNKWLSYYTYDMMTAFVFSGGSNMLEEGDPKGLLEDIRSGHVRMMFMSHVPWLGRLCYRLPPRLFSGLNAFRRNSHERAMKRKAQGSERKDLYYYLLDEGNPDAKVPEAQVISDGSSAVLGGSDTTASTMTLICYHLTTRPKVYERLKQEIDASGEGWNDGSVLAKMPYLNAVM
ncbi:cytochrome P450 [Marasmius fiardii PR-910]|nr:cytochrome P450 [Marasmius fiardii PR-910]